MKTNKEVKYCLALVSSKDKQMAYNDNLDYLYTSVAMARLAKPQLSIKLSWLQELSQSIGSCWLWFSSEPAPIAHSRAPPGPSEFHVAVTKSSFFLRAVVHKTMKYIN